MEEAPENGKESSHSAHANGMNVIVSLSPSHHNGGGSWFENT
jgi:hypothetical protein